MAPPFFVPVKPTASGANKTMGQILKCDIADVVS